MRFDARGSLEHALSAYMNAVLFLCALTREAPWNESTLTLTLPSLRVSMRFDARGSLEPSAVRAPGLSRVSMRFDARGSLEPPRLSVY